MKKSTWLIAKKMDQRFWNRKPVNRKKSLRDHRNSK